MSSRIPHVFKPTVPELSATIVAIRAGLFRQQRPACRYLLENEFGPDKQGLEAWGSQGHWPSWWKPVAAVYAANLAAHVIFPALNASYM